MGYRNKIIKIVTFLGGIYFFLEYFLPQSFLKAIKIAERHEDISNGFIVFSSMAFALGIFNLLLAHGTKVIFKRKDWFFSIVLLLGMFLMIYATFIDFLANEKISSKVKRLSIIGEFAEKKIKPLKEKNQEEYNQKIALLKKSFIKEIDLIQNNTKTISVKNKEITHSKKELNNYLNKLKSLTYSSDNDIDLAIAFSQKASVAYLKLLRTFHREDISSKLYRFLYEGLFVALGSAMFSLLAMYIAAAAFRAFRIKSVESTLMMLAAIVVMLGQIPFGLWISDSLPSIRLWLMEVPNTYAFRAIKIGAAVGGLIMAFRMWFSIESKSFSEKN